MSGNKGFDDLNGRILACRRCARLIEHCQQTAKIKRASYRDQPYHGQPVVNFGDPAARILVLGLAPGAHGANRTGRMFTGDRSGDFLYKVMYQANLASQPTAVDAHDGLVLHDTVITAACHCAPPQNKPTTEELAQCAGHLDDTFAVLPDLRVVICLGSIALKAMLKYAQRQNWISKMSPYRFAHGAEYEMGAGITVICAYHPSQQNTFTGRLTESMLLDVFKKAKKGLERRA